MIREAQYWKVCKTGFMFEMGATAASFIVYQRVRDAITALRTNAFFSTGS